MKIEIEVSIKNASELFQQFMKLLLEANAPKVEVVELEKEVNAVKQKDASPQKEAPQTVVAPQNTTTTIIAPQKPELQLPSLEELRARLRSLGPDKAKPILIAMGYAKLVDVPVERYGELHRAISDAEPLPF